MTDENRALNRKVTVIVNNIVMSDLRCTVSIEKSLKKSPNKLSLTVFNLSEKTRSQLQEIAPKKNTEQGIPVLVKVGYEPKTENEEPDEDIIWFGDLRNVISYKETPNWKTILTAGDGEKATQLSKMNQTFGPNTPIDLVLKAIIRKLNESLNDTSAITKKQTNTIINQIKMQGGAKLISSGVVLSGNTVDLLNLYCKSTGLEFSIQDGKIQLLNKRKATQDSALIVSTKDNKVGLPEEVYASGVIGSVEVDDEGTAKFTHLIKPGFKPGRIVQITSDRANGFYRIEKVNYNIDNYEVNTWTMAIEATRYS